MKGTQSKRTKHKRVNFVERREGSQEISVCWVSSLSWRHKILLTKNFSTALFGRGGSSKKDHWECKSLWWIRRNPGEKCSQWNAMSEASEVERWRWSDSIYAKQVAQRGRLKDEAPCVESEDRKRIFGKFRAKGWVKVQQVTSRNLE